MKGSIKKLDCGAKWNNQTYSVCLCPCRLREEKFLREHNLQIIFRFHAWFSTTRGRVVLQMCFGGSSSWITLVEKVDTMTADICRAIKLFCRCWIRFCRSHQGPNVNFLKGKDCLFLSFYAVFCSSAVLNLNWLRLLFESFRPRWRLTWASAPRSDSSPEISYR